MNRRYLAAIGLTVIVALALVIRALLFLHPSPGDAGREIHVRFQNVDKIAPRTRVTFAGKPVGEVTQVLLLPEVFDARAVGSRPIYSYEITLAIDSSVRVYKSDEISVKSEGLMGERVIAINPKPVPEGEELHLVGPDDILFAAPSGSAEEVLKEITITAQKTDQAIDSLYHASEQLTTLLTSLNRGHFGEKLIKMSEKTLSTLERVDALTQTVIDGLKGRGTIAKLMKDPGLYDSFYDCSRATKQLLADINTYGILFHTNRDWQRERQRREEAQSSLLSSSLPLSTRERFVKISRIMSELQSMLEQAENTLNRGSLRDDAHLREAFSQGLYNVQQQLDNLSEAVHNARLTETSDIPDEEHDEPL